MFAENPKAKVLDFKMHKRAIRFRPEKNTAFLMAKFNGIVQQIPKYNAKQYLVGKDVLGTKFR